MLNPKTTSHFSDETNSSVDHRYHESRELASRVLDLADAHLTPPFPKAYEVLYSYANGKNKSVVDQIDLILESSGSLDTYAIRQIYDQYFCPISKDKSGTKKANDAVKNELDSIIELIRTHIGTSREFGSALGHSLNDLSADTSPQQVKTIITGLLADNERMQAETTLLTDRLENSQKQMQTISIELEKAKRSALVDPVTGVGNRYWLSAKVEEQLEIARNTKEQFCLIFADIDYFKRVNDNFGHATGDQVLRFFGSLLQKYLDNKELVARYGGEEFVIIVPGPDLSVAKTLAEKIRAELEKSELILSVSKKPIGRITSSFGIARSQEDDTFTTVLQRADEQLYAAKGAGRNRIMCIAE